jgi:hypothetical protein
MSGLSVLCPGVLRADQWLIAGLLLEKKRFLPVANWKFNEIGWFLNYVINLSGAGKCLVEVGLKHYGSWIFSMKSFISKGWRSFFLIGYLLIDTSHSVIPVRA